jgi:uncharacterized protein (DUF1330 family)
VSLTLCVLLGAQPGADGALVAYEDQVLALVPEHGGRVLQRARSSGADGQPLEIQLIEFPSAQALDAYMANGRRTSLADERDRAVARTEVIDVELIQPREPRVSATPLGAGRDGRPDQQPGMRSER